MANLEKWYLSPPAPRHRHLAQSPHLRNLQCSPRETESADGLARPFHYLLTLFSVLSSPSCPVSALDREVLTAHPKLLTSYPAQVSPVHLVLIPIAFWAPQLHWNWSLTLCNLALALLGCSEPPIDLTQFRMSSPRVSQMSRVSLDLACSYHSLCRCSLGLQPAALSCWPQPWTGRISPRAPIITY